MSADLARTCFEKKGARLDVIASESLPFDNCTQPAAGTPVRWAVQKGYRRSFETFLAIHVAYEKPIADFSLVVGTAAAMHRPAFLRELLDFKLRKPHLCPSDSTEFLLESYLYVALDQRDMHMVLRHIENGSQENEMHRTTILTLLEFGTDPALNGDESTLFAALQAEDSISLELFVKYLSTKHPDPIRFLTRQDFARGDHRHNEMQMCLYLGARRCFKLLLKEFPTLMEAKNARGLTALHSAVYDGDNCDLVKKLLEVRADIFATSHDRSTPLFRALRGSNIAAADLIAERCTTEQLS